MKLTRIEWLRGASRFLRQNRVGVVLVVMGLLGMSHVREAQGQAMSTTTVQGTVYLANGQPGSGTLRVSWPTFTTANGQVVVADSTTAPIGQDGFVSVNLAPNLGATPAGLYYTAIFYLSDGTTNTEYWIVPSAAQASLAQVQSQVMPAAQAVQAVTKAYVDQSIAELSQSQLTASGGTLSGPLYLNADPTQPLQASDKHYVDTSVSQVVGSGISGTSISPQTMAGPLNGTSATFSGNLGIGSTEIGTAQGVAVTVAGAACNGTTDDTAAIQAALNTAGSQSAPPTALNVWGATQNLPQGTVTFPQSYSGAAQKVCKISSALNIPPGVSLDLGGAELDQITAGADAIASIWTVAGSSYGYGNQEGIIKHGVIVGPGQGVSTGAGIHLSGVNHVHVEDMLISGFKFGLKLENSQYSLFENIIAQFNMVGLYMTSGPTDYGVGNGFQPTGDDTFVGNAMRQNAKYGVWLQAANNNTFFKIDSNSNGEAAYLLGGQLTPFAGSYLVTASGSGYPASITFPVTVTDSYTNGIYNVYTATPGMLQCPSSTPAGTCTQTITGSGGSWTTEPTISVSIVAGAVQQVSVLTHGTCGSCTAAPTFTITEPVGSGGSVGTIALSDGSGNYCTNAEAMAQTNASGQVTNVWSLDGGQYCNNPQVSFAGHTGTGAAAKAEIVNDSGLGNFDGQPSTFWSGNVFNYPKSENEGYNIDTVTAASTAGGVATITIGNNPPPQVGQPVVITGVSSAAVNTSDAIVTSNAMISQSSSSFTFNLSGYETTCSSGCTPQVEALGRPTSGYGAVIQTYGGPAQFNYANFSMDSGINYHRWMLNGGFGVSVLNPNLGLSVTVNPANANDYSEFRSLQTRGLTFQLPTNFFSGGLTNAWALPNAMSFVIGSDSQSYPINVGSNTEMITSAETGATQGFGYRCYEPYGTWCFQSGQLGFAYPAWEQDANGVMKWGSGSAAYDVNIQRTGAGALADSGSWAAASYLVGSNTIIPSTVTGYHGTGGKQVQLSDGSGSTGSLPTFAADGSLTNGPAPPAGAIVGASDTQTLTNKSIAGSEVNSGMLPHAQLPTLLSADIPNNAASTTGSAASLSAASALPSGTSVPGYTLAPVAIGSKLLGTPTGTFTGQTRNQISNRILETLPFAVSSIQLGYCNLVSPGASYNQNDYNANPISIDATVMPNAAMVTDTNSTATIAATFHGGSRAWISPGQCIYSDPIPMNGSAGEHYYVRTGVQANPLPAPAAPTLTGTTGGFLNPSTTYYVSVVYETPLGDISLPGMTSQAPGGSNTAFTVTSPAAYAGSTCYDVFIGVASTYQYETGYDCVPLGTNVTLALGEPNGLQARWVNGSMTSITTMIPSGMVVTGAAGNAGNPPVNSYEGETAGTDQGYTGGSVSANSTGNGGYGTSTILGVPIARSISLGIVGDSILNGRNDWAYFGLNSTGANFGGWANRAADNQFTNTIWDPRIQPQWGKVNVSYSGETGSTFNSAFAGPRRKLVSNGTTTILDNYGTNDLNNPTSSTQTLNTLYQIGQYFTQQGKHYIHTTILPRLSSLDGFQTLANEIFTSSTFEGRRRQVNNVLLGMKNGGTVTGETMFAEKSGASLAYNTNFYAGGDGATTTFLTAYPFPCPNAVGSNAETVLVNGVATNAYTYYDQYAFGTGSTYCGGVTFTAAPTSGYTVTISYTTMPSFCALVGGDCNIFDAANVVEVNSAGTPGTNGGLWGIPGTTTIATGQTLTTWSASALTNTGGFNGGIAIDAWRGYTAILTGGGCSSSYAATDIYANSTTVLSVDPQTGCTPNASSTFKVLSATATTDGTHPSNYYTKALASALVSSGMVR